VTESERSLLIRCGVMLVRSTPLSAAEADEIDQLIAESLPGRTSRVSEMKRLSPLIDPRARELAAVKLARKRMQIITILLLSLLLWLLIYAGIVVVNRWLRGETIL
jgi:hypothetical protein